MRVPLSSVLTGAAVVLAIGAAVPAMAQSGQVHVLTVQLPGGALEQIQYIGDVPPHVVLVPTAAAAPLMATPSAMPNPFAMTNPFAMMQRISALMDQQAAAMMRQVQAMDAGAAMPALPPGASGSSFASTMSGNGVCMRSVSITFNGGDAAPKMVSSTSGDCGPSHGGGAPSEVTVPAPATRPVPATIEAKAAQPAGSAAQQVAWNR